MIHAKEKAKELVIKFTYHREHNESYVAKRCALICVDEILKYQPFDIYTIDQCNNVNNYWQEVKIEIEKL